MNKRESKQQIEWRHINGYHEEFQLVEVSTGRILGTVHGSQFATNDGWTSHDERRLPSKHLGRYISSVLAKAALLNIIEKRR